MNSHNSDTFCTFWPSSNLRRGGFAPYYLWHPKRSLTLPLPSIVSLFRMSVRVQPGQKTANTAVRQRNARIGGSIVEIDGIAIGCHGIAARKHHVLDVAMTFIFRFRRKHPTIPPNQAFFWLLKVEESQAQTVDGTRRRASNAVINHQPAARRFNWRRRHSNFVGIPPSPPAGLQHELVIAPMPQIGRVRDPDVSSERRHGPMDQSPRAVNPSGQKGRVFVVRRHDDAEPLEYAKIFRECQRHSGTATRIRSVSHGILLEFRHICDARIFDAP